MAKWLKTIGDLLINGGLGREAYEEVRPLINDANYRTWRIFAPLGAIYFSISFISTFFVNSVAANAWVYFGTMLIFAVATILLYTGIIKKDSKISLVLYQFLNFILLVFSTFIGTIMNADYLAVTFMVLLVAIPLITIDRPLRMEIILLVGCAVYAAACVLSKRADLVEIDLYNLACFWLVAFILSCRITSYRLKGFLMQRNLEESVDKDALTKVKNAFAYDKLKIRLDREIQEKTAAPFAIAVCDINHLKMVNDNYGHEKGDDYLKKNCWKICRIFKHSPVFRIGGDEFLIYLVGDEYSNRKELLELAETSNRINTFGTEDYDRIDFAIGMKEYEPDNDRSYLDVFKAADARMYECKQKMHKEHNIIVPVHQQSSKPLPADNRTIMLVDGNMANRSSLRKILEDRYHVVETENGQEALKIVRDKCDDIELIILNIEMPGAEGFEFMDVLRRDPVVGSIPVVVTTATEREDIEERCFSLGAKDLIGKPYNGAVLLRRIENIISFRRSSATLSAIEYDNLTGLYTRQAFYHYAQQMMASNPDVSFDLVISDLDDFKSINEIYGEEVGDEILIEIAQFLKHGAEEGVLVGRYGNDQFVGMFIHEDGFNDDFVDSMFEKMEQFNKHPNITINGKLGIYNDVERDVPISVICDRAMSALRTIKHQFGKTHAWYDKNAVGSADRKYQIEQRMQEAYETDQFKVYYQPKHETKTGKLIGAEALIRWEHPDFGFMSPGEFISIFEKNGFITYADYYVWKRTCLNLRKWIDKGLKVVPVSVNSSRRDFDWNDYLNMIINPVKEAGLDPHLLHIEVTESAFASNMDILREKLDECQKAGFRIELDDFGTGYSSLTILGSLPLDIVKLDMSFMMQYRDAKKARILGATVALAHSLGLKTVAEGVETVEQLELLKSLNCDRIQGYYYSKPLPEDEFEKYIRACMEKEDKAGEQEKGKETEQSGCYVIDENYNIISVNTKIMSMYPTMKIGEKCHKCLMNLDEPCDICPVKNNVIGPQTYLDPIRNVYETVDAVEIILNGDKKAHALVLSSIQD